MSWPIEFAYPESDTGRRREDLPFVATARTERLKIFLDSQCSLDQVETDYFAALRRSADTLNIDVLDITTARDSSIQSGVWTVDLSECGPEGQYAVRYADQSGRSSLRATAFHVDEFARQLADRDGIDFEIARHRQAVYEAAETIEVDVLVASTPPLFGFGPHRNMLVCDPRTAMSLVGLYQRNRGELLVLHGIPTYFDSQWAHFCMANGLLPELAGMFPRDGGDRPWEPTASLLRSTRTRLERALDDRDTLILRHLLSGRRTIRPSAEVALERIALNMVGMFDALARAVNEALELQVPRKFCSFSNDRFVRKTPPQIREAVRSERVGPILRIINPIRNTIHHESLGIGAYSGPSRTLEPLAGIPSADGEDFLAAIGEFPDLLTTTLDRSFGEDVYLRTLPFVELLMPMALRGVRAILAAYAWPGQPNRARYFYDDPVVHEQLRRLYAL
jgi:hypothetical protein